MEELPSNNGTKEENHEIRISGKASYKEENNGIFLYDNRTGTSPYILSGRERKV